MRRSRTRPRGVDRRRLLGGALLASGAAWLAACSGGSEDEEGGRGAAPGAAGATSNAVDAARLTLNAGISNDTGSPDPGSAAGTGGGSWPTTSILYDALTQLNEDTQKHAPSIAASWEVAPDGSAWVFKLRPGVAFHNGDPLTAEDVKFTYERQLGRAAYNPGFKGGNQPVWNRLIDAIETPDDLTVRFKMKVVDATAIVRFGNERILPMSYLTGAADDGFAAKPVGTGPYQLTERKVNERLELKAFPNYFGKDAAPGLRSAARIGTVVQKVIPEDQTRIAALQAGEVGLIYQVPPDAARRLATEKDLEVLYSEINAPIYIGINWKVEKDPVSGQPNPYRDVRVRQALNYAVNRDEIITKLLTGREKQTMMIGTNALGWSADWKPWPFDPKKARDLLAAAGHGSGLSARLSYPIGRWPATDEVCQALAGYWSEVGVKTTVQSLEYGALTTQIQQKSAYPFVFFGAASGPDPGFAFQGLFASTSTFGLHGGDAQVDALIAKAATVFDENERAKINAEIRTITWENAWWVPLYENVLAFGIDKTKWKWTPSKGTGILQYWKVEPA